jgi:putative ABC transport system permease protein
LFRSLPYRDPDRLVIACGDMLKRNVKDFPLSNVDYLDLRQQVRSAFDDFAAVQTFRGTLQRPDGTPERVIGGVVSANFFRLLGEPITAGRDFDDNDAVPQPPPPPNAPAAAAVTPPPALPRYVILSNEFWHRRYGADPTMFGKPLPGAPPQNGLIAVGVTAPRFELLFPPDVNIEVTPDFWVCGRIPYDVANRNNVQWRAIGRLKAGISLERAQSEADKVSEEINRGNGIKNTAGFHLRLDPMHAHLVADIRPAILALMGAALFLLLIACANVANLLLVRSSLRSRELAVRTALGASWGRLARQIVSEAVLLALIGGAGGIALAWAGIQELRAIAPANLPRLNAVAIDPGVLAFGLLAALASAALFGMAPVYAASRPDLIDQLRAAGRNAGLVGGGLLRNAVVVAQVALAFVLLIGSGLMFRSFLALQQVNPGFDPRNVLTLQLQGGAPPPNTPERRAAFQLELRDRLGAIPGVVAVGAAAPLPLAGGFSPIRWGLSPALSDPSRYQAADFEFVLPGYFEAMKVPVLAGRTFTQADSDPKRLVCIIDQILASKAFPDESAVGKRILTRVNTPEPVWMEVIGVVAHQRESSLAQTGREQLFTTDAYIGNFANNWVLRTSGSPANYATQVRAAIASASPQLLVTDLKPMDTWVWEAQSGTRFSLLLIGVFASMAAILAGIGLYGVLATLVRQRTAEIGLRLAVGAAPSSIFSLIVGQGMRLTMAGVALGLGAALVLTRAMTSMLIGVKPVDALTYVAMAVFFFAIATFSSSAPALRAARLDPTAALRDE